MKAREEFVEMLQFMIDLFKEEGDVGGKTVDEYTPEDIIKIITTCGHLYTNMENMAVLFASVLKQEFPAEYEVFKTETLEEIGDANPKPFEGGFDNDKPFG